ncbi:hypothetical protein [Candidatus Leptofilum sp.]|uniref:hypothetical protein n=1 Tax=Candidatus Leptofilum sp. TaxID=3241576 RepID=UPI003B5936F9
MKSINSNCCILIADGFAEKSVSQAVDFFLRQGIKPTFLNLFVSPLADELYTKYGVGSVLIGDFENLSLPDGLLFAGGAACAKHFLIDPRVYQLIRQIHEATKPVGYLYPVATQLAERLRPLSLNKPLLLQERLRIDQFLHDFLHRIQLSSAMFYQQPTSLLVF